MVDQFEELLTQTGPVQRARFAELLRSALTGPARVAGTLRPEFLDPLLSNPLRPAGLPALRAASPVSHSGAGLVGDRINPLSH